MTVPPAQTLRLRDVLGDLRPASNAALGLRFCEGKVYANARFFNTGAGDGATYGMFIPAMRESACLSYGEAGLFHHVSYSPDPAQGSRTNVWFVSASPFPVTVLIRLYGDDGVLIGTRTHELKAYEHRQFTRIHSALSTPAVENGYLTVEVTTPGGEVHPYVMVIENISGDPIYIPVTIEEP